MVDTEATKMVERSKDDLKKAISEFVSNLDPEELKKVTDASIVLLGDVSEIQIQKLDPRDIEKFLWMHPVMPRGIELKANRMIGRGIKVKGKVKDYVEYCADILKNSGGVVIPK